MFIVLCVLALSNALVAYERPVFQDGADVHGYLENVFHAAPFAKKRVTIRSHNVALTDIVDLLGATLGVAFVMNASVSGRVDKIDFTNQDAGTVLQFLCTHHQPRLALFFDAQAWHIAPYDDVVQRLSATVVSQDVQRVISLRHIRCTDMHKQAIEQMWKQVLVHPTDNCYCTITSEGKKIFLRGPKKAVQDMEQFIREIDCAVAQVRIDAIVAEVESTYEQQLGFNWIGVYNRQVTGNTGFHFAGIGGSSVADYCAINLFGKTAACKVPFIFQGPVGSLQQLTGELRAAENEHKARILLKPSVLTSHNEIAEILIGKSVPIKTMVEDVTQGKIRNTQTVHYKDVGTILNVRPLVTPDCQAVQLDIWVEDSSISELTIDGAPTIKTIRTKNKVTLKSGQATVIGGLMLKKNESAHARVPFISRIPLVGPLFQSHQENRQDSQLLIFITPTIVV